MSETDKKALVLLALLAYVCGLGACSATLQRRTSPASRPAQETGKAPADPLLLVAACS